MKYLLISFLFIAGCNSDNIRACGSSCNGFMKSYDTKNQQCICMTFEEMCKKGE